MNHVYVSDYFKVPRRGGDFESTQTRSAAQAQIILAYVFNEEYIEEPIDTGNGRYAYGEYTDNLSTQPVTFSLMPNPATDVVTASFDLINETDVAEITIYDLQGRIVASSRAPAGQSEMKINVSLFSRASYLAELKINHTLVARNKLLLIKN